MAKYKREVIGSFIKSKESDKPPYIKMRNAVSLKEGQTIRVESKKFQIDSLERAVAAGKVKGDMAEKVKERLEKMPDWVLGELVLLNVNPEG